MYFNRKVIQCVLNAVFCNLIFSLLITHIPRIYNQSQITLPGQVMLY